MSEVVLAKMFDNVLYVEATEYQLTISKHEVLSAEYEELRTQCNELKAELSMVRGMLNDED